MNRHNKLHRLSMPVSSAVKTSVADIHYHLLYTYIHRQILGQQAM